MNVDTIVAVYNSDEPADPQLWLGWSPVPRCSCGRLCCRVGMQRRVDDRYDQERRDGIWSTPRGGPYHYQKDTWEKW